MKIYVLTQEDAFYIPRILDHLLAKRRDVVGIGIHTGQSFVGSVGEGDALDFTALGDTVNVASRLTGLAAAGETLVSAGAAAANVRRTRRLG